MTRIDLPDGTYLDRIGEATDVGIDSDSGRTARWEAATSRLLDSEGNVIREVSKAPPRTTAKPRKASSGMAKPGCQTESPRKVAAERFNTMNQFVDDIARHLDDTERATWHVLYRHADAMTSTAEVNIATVADKIGRSTRSVMRAIEYLGECGLIERLHRGRKQTGPSRYRVATRPADCLGRIRQLSAERATPKRQRPQGDAGVTLNGAERDSYGRFST